ncbi:hypothetical protein PQO03_11445 [Lentisphaera profundi]|uniref:DUF3592 domain-containing protein n=1 Tax=Lentisphaera profundi TaxID=1658616 RepID=A0ABY7VST1_9BACT|nr:hypothetical protein [Lentisphaera profundi]WDE96323.1 hypothetical protein PQO03_11445 [Lentisphaera profundi]
MKNYLSNFLLFGSLVFICVGSLIAYMVYDFFNTVSEDQEKWASRKKIVATGQIDPLEAKVVRKRYEKTKRTTGIGVKKRTKIDRDYWVDMEVATIGPVTRGVTGIVYERISEGQSIQVYPIDGVYVIPAFDTGDDKSTLFKWIFLCLSSLPLLAGLLGVCFAVGMKVRQRPAGP